MTRGPGPRVADGELGGPAAAVGQVFLDAVLVHHINDRAERTNRLGISKARRVAVLDHDVEARPHQMNRAAVKDLLFEVVPFGFVVGRSSRPRPRVGTDSLRDRQHDSGERRGSRRVIVADAAIDAFALQVLLTHKAPGRVRNIEDRVDVLRRLDGAVEDVEPMAETERLTARRFGPISAL